MAGVNLKEKWRGTPHYLGVYLMKGLPLGGVDAARLVLECVEGLDGRAVGLGRVELMELVRRVMRAGIAALVQQERTVPFEQAAWESVEARAGRFCTAFLRLE